MTTSRADSRPSGNKDSSRRTFIPEVRGDAEPPSLPRCGDAGAALRQGRPAGGLEQRSSQVELDVCPPPSLSLSPLAHPLLSSSASPALAVKASSGRFRVRRAVHAGSIPALLLLLRTRGRFPQGW